MSVLDKAGFTLEKITAEGIKGRGLLRQLRSMWKIPIGIFESMRIIKNFKPDLVMGVGSYAAGPVVIGAWFMRKKLILHEQNILPGITNRILSRLPTGFMYRLKTPRQTLIPEKFFIQEILCEKSLCGKQKKIKIIIQPHPQKNTHLPS